MKKIIGLILCIIFITIIMPARAEVGLTSGINLFDTDENSGKISALGPDKSKFKPKLKLLTEYKYSKIAPEQPREQPYIAVFEKGGKTLIYHASKHDDGKTYDMTNYVFNNFSPQVTVIEFQRSGPKPGNKYSGNEFEYIAAVASDKNIPVALADLSAKENIEILQNIEGDYLNIRVYRNVVLYKIHQARWIIHNALDYEREFGGYTTAAQEVASFNNFVQTADEARVKKWFPHFSKYFTNETEFISWLRKYFDKYSMNEKEFNRWFKNNFYDVDFDAQQRNGMFKETFSGNWDAPVSPGRPDTVFSKMNEDIDYLGRNPFMLKNIAAALNKYNVVYAAFGGGHYITHREVLEKMLGKPRYIPWDAKYITIINQDEDSGQSFKIKEEILVPKP